MYIREMPLDSKWCLLDIVLWRASMTDGHPRRSVLWELFQTWHWNSHTEEKSTLEKITLCTKEKRKKNLNDIFINESNFHTWRTCLSPLGMSREHQESKQTKTSQESGSRKWGSWITIYFQNRFEFEDFHRTLFTLFRASRSNNRAPFCAGKEKNISSFHLSFPYRRKHSPSLCVFNLSYSLHMAPSVKNIV